MSTNQENEKLQATISTIKQERLKEIDELYRTQIKQLYSQSV